MTLTSARLRHPAAIIFDFDGTIAETERLGHRIAYNMAFAALGLDWMWDEALYGELLAVAGGKERIAFYLERRYTGDARSSRIDGTILSGEALIAALHERKSSFFRTLVDTLAFRPGVQRLVREARAAGVHLAIATTAARAGVDALLARDPELRDAFAVIAAGDVVPHKKPAPDIYAFALRALDVPARSCVAIEDSEIGVWSARGAGIVTLVTLSDYTRGENFAGAAAVLSDLGEPHAPARTLAGPAPANGIVDVAYVRGLLA